MEAILRWREGANWRKRVLERRKRRRLRRRRSKGVGEEEKGGAEARSGR